MPALLGGVAWRTPLNTTKTTKVGASFLNKVVTSETTMKTIFRTQRLTGNFTILPNSTLRDKRLSFRARGVLAMILSNTEDWEVTKAWLQSQGTEGREAIDVSMKELQAAGYATFQTHERTERGAFKVGVWTFTDVPAESCENGVKPPLTASRQRQASTGKPATKKDYPKEGLSVEDQSEETKERTAVPAAMFDPEWKPNPEGKKKQLKGIQTPHEDSYPCQRQFEEFCESEGLDAVLDSKRPCLYADLCDAKWHQWKHRANRWLPIRDWRSYVRALAVKLDGSV